MVLPGGASFSPANLGGDDTKDSDVLSSGSDFGFTGTILIASNVISITNLDMGLTNVQPTATPKPGQDGMVYLPIIFK